MVEDLTAQGSLPIMKEQEKAVCLSKNANKKQTHKGKSVDISGKPTRSVVELRGKPHEP
nr:hypothetical protein SYMBAF_90092 [Serratia symbiotica]